MLRSLLLLVLLLPTGAFAQEGVINYEGQQTIKFSRDFLLATLPEEVVEVLDSAMIEMALAQTLAEDLITPLFWETSFSGQAVVGRDMAGSGARGVPAMTPFTGGMDQLSRNVSGEIYIDYETDVVITAVPSTMAEPYIVTEDLGSALIPNWEMMTQDSTILGYPVFRAAAEVDVAVFDKFMADILPPNMDLGMEIKLDSASMEVWYTPDLTTPAGPFMIGAGLPGAILHARIDASMSGANMKREVSAVEVATTVDNPVGPPTGTEIEQDDLQEITKFRMDMLMRQLRVRQ